jgi:hypothetical protein
MLALPVMAGQSPAGCLVNCVSCPDELMVWGESDQIYRIVSGAQGLRHRPDDDAGTGPGRGNRGEVAGVLGARLKRRRDACLDQRRRLVHFARNRCAAASSIRKSRSGANYSTQASNKTVKLDDLISHPQLLGLGG